MREVGSCRCSCHHTNFCSEDFRSAMQQANSCIKSLLSLSRQTAPLQSSAALSPSTSPSSSALPNPTSANLVELNRSRIDAMTRLIGVLQRNLRVRYELDIAEVVQA